MPIGDVNKTKQSSRVCVKTTIVMFVCGFFVNYLLRSRLNCNTRIDRFFPCFSRIWKSVIRQSLESFVYLQTHRLVAVTTWIFQLAIDLGERREPESVLTRMCKSRAHVSPTQPQSQDARRLVWFFATLFSRFSLNSLSVFVITRSYIKFYFFCSIKTIIPMLASSVSNRLSTVKVSSIWSFRSAIKCRKKVINFLIKMNSNEAEKNFYLIFAFGGENQWTWSVTTNNTRNYSLTVMLAVNENSLCG